MLKNLEKYQIILASQSPRRRELLKSIIPEFKTISLDVNEVFPPELKREEIARYLSELKARAYTFKDDNELIITSDTIVWLNDQQLGKPKNAQEAKHMLQGLSNNINEVITAVTLKTSHFVKSFYEVTQVHFKPLTDQEIDYYITTYKPFDKAGAYGIQEWIGQIGIIKIDGDYYNVMGLPTARLYKELSDL